MKNRYIEQKKHLARQYHRQKSSHFVDGIISRHLYDAMQPDTLTYWDDAVFIVNDYRVALWWTHPRYEYSELIKEEAGKRVDHLRPDIDLFKNCTPNYKRLGRSRKKIMSWTSQPNEQLIEYGKLCSAAERQVEKDVPFEVRPSLSINWLNWAKGVSLCMPFEVRSNSDLKDLVEIARRLVKRELTLQAVCSDYVYTQTDWLNERPLAA